MSVPDPPPRTPLERAAALIETLRRRWVAALVVFVVGFGTTLAVLLGGEDQYAASAQILLQRSDAVSQVLSPGVVPSPANAQRDIDTNTRLITSRPVLEAVSRRLNHSLSPTELADKLEVSGQDTSNLVSITAHDADPRRAAQIATVAALEYERYRLSTGRAAIESAIDAGRARLDDLQTQPGSSAESRALRDRLIQLETSAAIGVDSAQLIRRALIPTEPESQHRMLAVASSLLIAALLALAAAAVLDLLDKRLRSASDVEDALGVPVVTHSGLAATLALSERDPPQVILVSPLGLDVPASRPHGVLTDLAEQLLALGRDVKVIKGSASKGTGSPDLQRPLKHARATADFVLMRGPAATEPAALPLAAASDGILLVAELPGVTKDDASALGDALGALREKLVGVILCSPSPRHPLLRYLGERTAPTQTTQTTPEGPALNGDGAAHRPAPATLTRDVVGGRENG
jgi:capsular polysaccharide biosynthesis protein